MIPQCQVTKESFTMYQRDYKNNTCEYRCLVVTASFAFCIITFVRIEVQTLILDEHISHVSLKFKPQ